MFTNFNYYKLIIFSIKRNFYQIIYTKVPNYHDLLLLIRFFWQNQYIISIQKQPSGDVLLGDCSVSVLWIYGRAPMLRYSFNRVAYAALWRSLFRMGVFLLFLLCICRTLFFFFLHLVLQYMGIPTKNLIKQLKRSNDLVQPILTLWKQKTYLWTWKPVIKE